MQPPLGNNKFFHRDLKASHHMNATTSWQQQFFIGNSSLGSSMHATTSWRQQVFHRDLSKCNSLLSTPIFPYRDGQAPPLGNTNFHIAKQIMPPPLGNSQNLRSLSLSLSLSLYSACIAVDRMCTNFLVGAQLGSATTSWQQQGFSLGWFGLSLSLSLFFSYLSLSACNSI